MARKECPHHLLLAIAGNKNDENMREIIKYFDIEYQNNDTFYSRYTICNGPS